MPARVASKRNALAGLTLDEVLANQKREAAAKSRTLLEIIREDETNDPKDWRTWKPFQDKLRLKRSGSVWTSTIHIPASDISTPFYNNRTLSHFQTHSNTNGSTHHMAHQPDEVIDPTTRQFSRWSSTRYGSPIDATFPGDSSDNAHILRPQMSRRNSSRAPSQGDPFRRERVVTFRDNLDNDDDGSDEDNNGEPRRALSAREAVAAQEAAEAAAAAAAEEEKSVAAPVSMSLMDLLEETDRQMGFEGSRYIMSDEEDEDEEEEVDEDGGVGAEYNCCVCMVRHRAAAFRPCGHTFCMMCSRELNVSKGNCPLCNNFILEILEVF